MLDALLAEARLRWGLDPAAGIQVAAAERLVATPIEPSRPLFVVPLAVLDADMRDGRDGSAAPATAEPLPGRNGPLGRDPVALLRRLYPADHPIGRFGAPSGTTIGALSAADLAAPIYFAPIVPELAIASPWSMPFIAERLRRPDGCPWDREQTHASLRKHLLEEAYEVYDALERGATPALADELGDLLLQVILHAQLAAEEGAFDLADVNAALASKIVRRHPHVFGDAEVRTAADVSRQWERIKAAERAAAAAEGAAGAHAAPEGEPESGSDAPRAKSALAGVSRALPALAASQEMQERAANLGYDWPSIDGVLDKVREELDELRAAPDAAARTEEFGDLLFVLVNVGRKDGIEVEAALRAANDKFRRRFASVERQAAERGVVLRDLDFEALDALWDNAKAEESAARSAKEGRR